MENKIEETDCMVLSRDLLLWNIKAYILSCGAAMKMLLAGLRGSSHL